MSEMLDNELVEVAENGVSNDLHLDSPRDDEKETDNGQVEISDETKEVVSTVEDSDKDDRSDAKLDEGGKEDMFVDCPDELVIPDHKEPFAAFQIQEELEENDYAKEAQSDESNSVGPVTDDLVTMQVKLEKAIKEKESTKREYQEERDIIASDLANLYNQLATLNGQPAVGEIDGGLEEEKRPDAPLHETLKGCLHMVKYSLNERVYFEGTVRELQEQLYKKDLEIEDLHSKINNVTSEQKEIEAVSNSLLATLVAEAYDGRFSNDPVITKLSHVEKSASLLIEYYNHFISEANMLNHCLNEVRPDLVMQDDFGKTFASTREVLVELNRNEVDLCQKISNLDEENKLLLAKLDQINEESQNLKAEIEQEKTKFANTKEKLSMAVTRGKALVQQRDSLKQYLAEKSHELEKCMTELQQQTIALEAAERTKEELVKCENLASKLQDALELKDNILADCEGMFSDGASSELDQSINIAERVRLLLDERNSMKGLKIEFEKLNNVLSQIDMPETVLTSDLESRVNWLMESFSKKIHEIAQTKESAQNEIERLASSFLAETQEKNLLYDELQELTFRYQVAAEKENQASQDKNQMVNMLIEGAGITTDELKDVSMSPFDITRFIDLCFGKVKQEIGVSGRSLDHDTEIIERMQTLVYIKDVELASSKLVLEEDAVYRLQVIKLSDKLEAITGEFQALDVERSSLKKDLEKAEDKSSLLREKLSMAVKKGKGLVQERENLKQLIEEKTAEIEKLKQNSQNEESALNNYKEEIEKLSTVTAQIPKLEADLMDANHQKDELEKFLVESNTIIQRMIVAIDDIVLPVDLVFKEPAEKLKWFADYLKDCHAEKALAEEELAKLKDEADSLTMKLTESERSMKALEEAVALANNDYSQIVEEKKELEISKIKTEQELQKVLKEASTEASKSEEISKSLQDALNCRINAEADVEEVREELSIQTSKLSEAYRTIKSLEDALFQAETNLSLLAEENNKAQVGRSSVENEMRKLTEEADSQVNKFADACLRIKSLEDYMLKADSSINELSSAKEIAEEEILALKAKLKACVEELDGVHNRVESRSLALSDHFDDLQALLQNDRLTVMFRKSFTSKYENLKQINLLIDGIKDHLIKIESKTALSVEEVDLDTSKFNEVLENIANVEVDEGETADGDNKESHHNKIVEKFHLRQNTLEDTFETLSSFVDEFLASLSTKLQVTMDEVLLALDNSVLSKDKMFHLEKERDEQEKKISALEVEIAVLLSACSNVTQKLEMEIENSVQEQIRNTLPAKADNFSSNDTEVDEHALEDHMHSESINVKTAERLCGKVRVLCENFDNEREGSTSIINGLQNKLEEITKSLQNAEEERDLNQTWASRYESELEDVKRSSKVFGDEREVSTETTKELQKELDEIKRTLEIAVEERDLNQNRASKLESDLEALHKSCKQFSDENDLSVSRISELHDELMKTRRTLEAASEERDLNLHRTSQLEANLGELEKACNHFAEERELSTATVNQLRNEFTQAKLALENALEERDLCQARASQLEANLGELEKACNHFAGERELSTATVNELRNEFTQAKLALENALEERDLCQARASNLESELEVSKVERELSDANTNALQSKLTKMDRALENALQDRDFHQTRTSKLENDIEGLQMSCKEMKLKLVEYEEELTLKEKEASISLIHDTVISDEVAKDILEKVDAIEIRVTDIKGGYNTQTQDNSGLIKKLFNILDSVDEMQHQINLLSHDKEELQLTLASKVDEEEEYIKENRELDKMKAEFLDLEQCLDSIIQKLGGDMQSRDQKRTNLRELVSTLEKLVITIIEESESSKFKAQELGVRFLANQNLVDELSSKLKLVEDSNKYRTSSPEVVQERKIFEAPPLPTRSEITEIEDGGGLVAKKAVSSSVPSAAHVRTLRKGSNDHLVINMDSESEQLINNEETTEDKGHIFKSLNTSGLVPKQGKLIADRVDGIWVSCSRALMNHPRARLGVVAYLLFMHLWLLGSIIL